MPPSTKFGLISDVSADSSWYKRRAQACIQKNKKSTSSRRKKPSLADDSDLTPHIDANNSSSSLSVVETAIESDDNEPFDVNMDDLNTQPENIKQQLNKDCLDYIQKNSTLISSSLGFLFDAVKRNEFFLLLNGDTNNNRLGPSENSDDHHRHHLYLHHQESSSSSSDSSSLNNSLNRFIQLYVPLDFMRHLSTQTKLNLITQFLLTNKTEESKIELIIELANFYAQSQEWGLVLSLLNSSTQDNEELNELSRCANNKFASYRNGLNDETDGRLASLIFKTNTFKLKT